VIELALLLSVMWAHCCISGLADMILYVFFPCVGSFDLLVDPHFKQSG